MERGMCGGGGGGAVCCGDPDPCVSRFPHTVNTEQCVKVGRGQEGVYDTNMFFTACRYR